MRDGLVRGTWSALTRQIGGDPEVLAVDEPDVVRRQVVPLGLGAKEAIGVLAENSLRHGAGAVGITVRSTGRSGEPRGSGGMVVLEVSDEGPGVPEGLVAHIFDRGVSTASSTGIGLGLARAFIEADGGRLELRRAAPPIFAIFLAIGQAPAVVDPEGAPGAAATDPPVTGPTGTGSTVQTSTGGPPAGR